MTLLPKHMFFSRGGKLEVEMMRVARRVLELVLPDGVAYLVLEQVDEVTRAAVMKILQGQASDEDEPDQE